MNHEQEEEEIEEEEASPSEAEDPSDVASRAAAEALVAEEVRRCWPCIAMSLLFNLAVQVQASLSGMAGYESEDADHDSAETVSADAVRCAVCAYRPAAVYVSLVYGSCPHLQAVAPDDRGVETEERSAGGDTEADRILKVDKQCIWSLNLFLAVR